MKPKFLLAALLCAFIVCSSFTFSYDSEMPLFDKNGEPKAFMDDEYNIFLWNGEPVAYGYNSGEEWHIYGYNGKHLGWFSGAFIYDKKGKRVSSPFNSKNKYLPFKGFKKITPIKSIREFEPFSKPKLSDDWSDTLLEAFLKAGEK